MNGKIIENQFGVRLSSADYHDRQWSAPSLETLAREFKDVVKTSELVIYYMYFFSSIIYIFISRSILPIHFLFDMYLRHQIISEKNLFFFVSLLCTTTTTTTTTIVHKIRANDENDPTRIGKGLSDESVTAIERCEKSKSFFLAYFERYCFTF